MFTVLKLTIFSCGFSRKGIFTEWKQCRNYQNKALFKLIIKHFIENLDVLCGITGTKLWILYSYDFVSNVKKNLVELYDISFVLLKHTAKMFYDSK